MYKLNFKKRRIKLLSRIEKVNRMEDKKKILFSHQGSRIPLSSLEEKILEEARCTPIPPIPQQYRDDGEWLFKNLSEIERDYAGKWVVVYNKQVFSSVDPSIWKTTSKIEEKKLKKQYPDAVPVYWFCKPWKGTKEEPVKEI